MDLSQLWSCPPGQAGPRQVPCLRPRPGLLHPGGAVSLRAVKASGICAASPGRVPPTGGARSYFSRFRGAGGGAREQKIRETRTWAFSQGLHELDDKYLVISPNFKKIEEKEGENPSGGDFFPCVSEEILLNWA